MNNGTRRSSSIDPTEYPFESHWFRSNGNSMHYLDEGQGFPILMLHGNPIWSLLYRKVIKRAQGTCRILSHAGISYG